MPAGAVVLQPPAAPAGTCLLPTPHASTSLAACRCCCCRPLAGQRPLGALHPRIQHLRVHAGKHCSCGGSTAPHLANSRVLAVGRTALHSSSRSSSRSSTVGLAPVLLPQTPRHPQHLALSPARPCPACPAPAAVQSGERPQDPGQLRGLGGAVGRQNLPGHPGGGAADADCHCAGA